MPVFDFFHWDKERGSTLEETGPLVQVQISLPGAVAEFCATNQIAIPPPLAGWALIDAGASTTAVDEECLLSLGIQPIDAIPTNTPSGSGRSLVYPARVTFPGLQLADLRMDRVFGAKLNWQTPDSRSILMLLGRDMLKHFLLVYNGPGTNITLSY